MSVVHLEHAESFEIFGKLFKDGYKHVNIYIYVDISLSLYIHKHLILVVRARMRR